MRKPTEQRSFRIEAGDPPNERLLKRDEVAEQFGLSRRWLELAALHGNGPIYVKIGRMVRYRAGDVRAFLAARERTSTSDTGQG